MEETTHGDKYEAHVDLMNECRSFYYSRLQKTEHYREVFCKNPEQDTENETTADGKSTLASSMQRLQNEIISLLDQDLILMRQMLTLNENIEEMKNRPFPCFSKESFGSSLFSTHSRHHSASEVHLPTVYSESEFEQQTEPDNTVFEEIRLYIDEQNFDSCIETTPLKHQTSIDSGFLE